MAQPKYTEKAFYSNCNCSWLREIDIKFKRAGISWVREREKCVLCFFFRFLHGSFTRVHVESHLDEFHLKVRERGHTGKEEEKRNWMEKRRGFLSLMYLNVYFNATQWEMRRYMEVVVCERHVNVLEVYKAWRYPKAPKCSLIFHANSLKSSSAWVKIHWLWHGLAN
jgi:hypothetical protein